jgi:hypothetical protein
MSPEDLLYAIDLRLLPRDPGVRAVIKQLKTEANNHIEIELRAISLIRDLVVFFPLRETRPSAVAGPIAVLPIRIPIVAGVSALQEQAVRSAAQNALKAIYFARTPPLFSGRHSDVSEYANDLYRLLFLNK